MEERQRRERRSGRERVVLGTPLRLRAARCSWATLGERGTRSPLGLLAGGAFAALVLDGTPSRAEAIIGRMRAAAATCGCLHASPPSRSRARSPVGALTRPMDAGGRARRARASVAGEDELSQQTRGARAGQHVRVRARSQCGKGEEGPVRAARSPEACAEVVRARSAGATVVDLTTTSARRTRRGSTPLGDGRVQRAHRRLGPLRPALLRRSHVVLRDLPERRVRSSHGSLLPPAAARAASPADGAARDV